MEVPARPRVIITAVTSLDGRITVGPHSRLLDADVAARWNVMKPPTSERLFQTAHAAAGATVILQGSGSFVDVDASAPAWPAPRLPEAELWQDHVPLHAERWFVVADARGRVDWTYTGDGHTRLHILVCRRTPPGYLQRLRDLRIGYFIVGREEIDLLQAFRRIVDAFDPETIHVDGGGTFNASMIRSGLVDEIDVLILPGVVGGATTPSLLDGPALGEGSLPTRLEMLECSVSDGVIHARYRVLGPPNA